MLQTHGFFGPSDIDTLQEPLAICVDEASALLSMLGQGQVKRRHRYGRRRHLCAAVIRLSVVNVSVPSSTFDYVAVGVSSGPSSCIVVVIVYTWPGSLPVTAAFSQLVGVLDHLLTSDSSLQFSMDIYLRPFL